MVITKKIWFDQEPNFYQILQFSVETWLNQIHNQVSTMVSPNLVHPLLPIENYSLTFCNLFEKKLVFVNWRVSNGNCQSALVNRYSSIGCSISVYEMILYIYIMIWKYTDAMIWFLNDMILKPTQFETISYQFGTMSYQFSMKPSHFKTKSSQIW